MIALPLSPRPILSWLLFDQILGSSIGGFRYWLADVVIERTIRSLQIQKVPLAGTHLTPLNFYGEYAFEPRYPSDRMLTRTGAV